VGAGLWICVSSSVGNGDRISDGIIDGIIDGITAGIIEGSNVGKENSADINITFDCLVGDHFPSRETSCLDPLGHCTLSSKGTLSFPRPNIILSSFCPYLSVACW